MWKMSKNSGKQTRHLRAVPLTRYYLNAAIESVKASAVQYSVLVMEFPDVYEWICRACHLKAGTVEPLELNVFADYKYSVLLRAKSYEGKMCLSFYFLEGGTSIGKYEIGRYDIGNYSEESMQNNLLPVLLWLFIDPFILRSSKVIYEALSGYLDMFGELKLQPGIIEPTKFRRVFNSLISAGCTFFTKGMEGELAQTQQKILLLMGPAGTHRFMGILASTLFLFSFLSSKFHFSLTKKIFKRKSSIQRLWMQRIFERVSRISYNSSSGGSWSIMSYSPLSSLATTKRYLSFREKAHLRWAEVERERLRWALKNNQLQSVLMFKPEIKLCPDCIIVRLYLDNVRCDVFPLDRISDNKTIRGLPDERHFPAKIRLTIGPEDGSVVQSISLSMSSANPTIEIGRGNTYEATIQTDMLGVKASTSTTVLERINKWDFGHSVENNTNAKIDWTLYDTTTGKAVFENEPPKISMLSAKTVRSIYKAFTEQGGVVFAKDKYGRPITWRLNRNLEGRTLKWKVQASIWITYWSSTDRIRYFETKYHEFSQVVDLTLLQSSSSTSN